jgi:23S rRNA (guanosine2251-2'-O)-methyltransferase
MSRHVLGLQAVREALRAPNGTVRELLLEAPSNPKLDGLARLAESRGVPTRRVGRGDLDRLSRGGRHQGAIALAEDLRVLDRDELYEVLEGAERPTVMILDGVMDPQNFGAVVRSAVALGAPFVVWPEHSSAPLTPATFRASAGAVEHATLCRVRALPDLLLGLRDRGFTVVVLDARGEAPLESVELTGPVAIVVGAEDKGSRPAVRRAATCLAHLPIERTIDSLNASVASALALYEVGRQRRKDDKTTVDS